jgi:hypothetical protein
MGSKQTGHSIKLRSLELNSSNSLLASRSVDDVEAAASAVVAVDAITSIDDWLSFVSLSLLLREKF